ncbi:MAG TPA: DUF6134 family protein [Geminicoccaceae bacterium]|nr:DUF6134 family protein [Geminicoccus sp.]HMU52491.1 DUF6134 family protein [Geminicoccaceae bacterium]
MRRLTSVAGGVAIPRRGLLGLAAAGLLWPGRPAVAAPGSVTFRVLRKGTDIGMHQVAITPTSEGDFTVDVKIELAVKLAMITVFYYRQSARDTWRDGKLVAADYRTDDDGKVSVLKVRENKGQLRIEGSSGSAEAPLGTMTDLAFWNESIVDAPRVVDSQTGQVGVMHTGSRAKERIVVDGRELDATRYSVSGSEERRGTVWYVQRQWVKASFVTRGEALEYVLA